MDPIKKRKINKITLWVFVGLVAFIILCVTIAPSSDSKPEKSEREVLIEKQFSSWNGAHPALEKLIKKNLNDPDSYEHVETRFQDMKDHIFVVTQIRAKNTFGAKVLQTFKADVDFDGNVIKVFE